jgi:Bacterial regulatory protein, Fis family
MGRMQPHAPISSAWRRRLAGWLIGSSLRDIERDLVLETLSHTRGNRTAAADTADKIVEYFSGECLRSSP